MLHAKACQTEFQLSIGVCRQIIIINILCRSQVSIGTSFYLSLTEATSLKSSIPRSPIFAWILSIHFRFGVHIGHFSQRGSTVDEISRY